MARGEFIRVLQAIKKARKTITLNSVHYRIISITRAFGKLLGYELSAIIPKSKEQYSNGRFSSKDRDRKKNIQRTA